MTFARAYVKYYCLILIACVINFVVNWVASHTGAFVFGTVHTDYTVPVLIMSVVIIFPALAESKRT